MKLAEALSERADIQKRLQQLRSRLQNNAKVQEGETPSEEPEALLKELRSLSARLEELIYRINMTNAETLCDGESLTALLARRDALALKTDILRGFLSAASETVMRGMRTEIVIRSTVDVSALQKDADALSKELRELDTRIQSANWLTELK